MYIYKTKETIKLFKVKCKKDYVTYCEYDDLESQKDRSSIAFHKKRKYLFVKKNDEYITINDDGNFKHLLEEKDFKKYFKVISSCQLYPGEIKATLTI